jgi:ATP-binding cassette subfamily C (CFTR/MRP) protein 1
MAATAPTTPLPCSQIDGTFGPHAGQCRGGFDFTLFFEETILSILPIALMMVVAPFRLYYLFKKDNKVVRSILLPSKLVGHSCYSRL